MKIHPLFQKLVPILYNDDDLIVLDKPAGVDVGSHPDPIEGSLLGVLTVLAPDAPALHPVNRLVRAESGILVLAKRPAAAEQLRTLFKSGSVRYEFSAFARGKLTRPQWKIGAEHGQSRGKNRPKKAQGKSSTRSTKAKTPTILTLVKRETGRSLIRCQTTVDTTHALRAQIRSAGLFLVGNDSRRRTPAAEQAEKAGLHLSRLSFLQPFSKTRVDVRSRASAPIADGRDAELNLDRVARAALVKRLPLVIRDEVNAFRLMSGHVEGVPGLTVEKYGDLVLLTVSASVTITRPSLLRLEKCYRDTIGVRSACVKRLGDSSPARGAQGITPSTAVTNPLTGGAVPDELEVDEYGLKFTIRPGDGSAVGLFLDHRENRQRVRSLSEGRDVLNLFAYTCGFSVAAAVGGAKSVTSVDLSPKHLEWGKANFLANKLDPSKHRFFQDDVLAYLGRAARRDDAFDLIVLDPPTYAHGRKRKKGFSIARDLPELVKLAAAILRPDGVLVVSTNSRTLRVGDLRERIDAGLGRRKAEVFDTPRLPVDFAMDPLHAKTVFLRLA